MLPSLNSAQLSLADVLPSCLASMNVAGFENTLSLPAVRSSIVVLIDGLGAGNLRLASAHARFLSAHLSGTISSVFPSTTAAALASLATGQLPGVHGITGYRILDPESGILVNQLTGLGTLEKPAEWLQTSSLFSIDSCPTFVVGHPRFEHTPLSQMLYGGSVSAPAYTLDDRISRAAELAQQGTALIFLYISELDETAHKSGVDSTPWATKLEDVDAALNTLMRRIPADVGVFVTADHGITDVPVTHHRYFGIGDDLLIDVKQIGGEPRCLQLYLEGGISEEVANAVLQRWQDTFGDEAWILSKQEFINAGLLGKVSAKVSHRLGDIFILARENIVFYDGGDHTRSGQSMVGQHGAISELELEIPAIRLGAYREN